MGAIDWQEVVALLTSIGFGVLSAIFPPANAETYVLASQVSAVAGVVPIAVGVGVGQTIGKMALFLGVREGRESRFFHRQRVKARAGPVSPTRLRLRRMVRQLLDLVGTKRWGLPIVFVAALVGVPPLYAVALLAGATKMRLSWFGLLVLVGRLGRFLAVAFVGVHGVHF